MRYVRDVNAEVDSENIYEVLIGACADSASISELYEASGDSPYVNTILYHLNKKFDLHRLNKSGANSCKRMFEIFFLSSSGISTAVLLA